MQRFLENQLDDLCDLLPGPPPRPKGGRPRTDKRKAVAGIFWILCHGAKWVDLPAEFGTKSSVNRALHRWVRTGAFESLLAKIGTIVEERGDFTLYEFRMKWVGIAGGGGDENQAAPNPQEFKGIRIAVDSEGRPILARSGVRKDFRQHGAFANAVGPTSQNENSITFNGNCSFLNEASLLRNVS